MGGGCCMGDEVTGRMFWGLKRMGTGRSLRDGGDKGGVEMGEM